MRCFGFLQPLALFPIWIGRGEEGISRISIGTPLDGPDWVRNDDDSLIRNAAGQIEEYFARQRRGFDLPLELEGTAFQLRVWKALLCIPYGETRTYSQLASAAGSPGAARAAGAANGANPIALIVPCHRVIAAGGGLGGYACGLDRKQFLLDLESGNTAGLGAWV